MAPNKPVRRTVSDYEHDAEALFASIKEEHGEAKARQIFTKTMAGSPGRKTGDRDKINRDALNAAMRFDEWREQSPGLPKREFYALLAVERRLAALHKKKPDESEAYFCAEARRPASPAEIKATEAWWISVSKRYKWNE
jgi:hypothetical protein